VRWQLIEGVILFLYDTNYAFVGVMGDNINGGLTCQGGPSSIFVPAACQDEWLLHNDAGSECITGDASDYYSNCGSGSDGGD
jgi:hypothetical protein